jgi:hypothetical protein
MARKINPNKARRALQIISALPLSHKHQTVIHEVLQRSASEVPAVIQMLDDMDDERKMIVIQTAHDIQKATNSHLKQARDRLLEMSEDDWQALVDEANDDEPTT